MQYFDFIQDKLFISVAKINNITDIFLSSSQITFAVAWAGVFNPELFRPVYTYFSIIMTVNLWLCYYLLKKGEQI